MYSSLAKRHSLKSLWMSMIISSGAMGVLVGVAVPGHALDVCDDPSNQTLNCNFTYGIRGWVQYFGNSFLHSIDGNNAPGSIEGTSQSTMGYSLTINQCVGGLSGLPSVNYGAWVRVVAGTVGRCYVKAYRYTDDNCTTYLDMNLFEKTPRSGGWTWVGGQTLLEPTVAGIRIAVQCSSTSDPFTVRIDDIYLGEGVGDAIFLDGFEFGDTSAWSATVP